MEGACISVMGFYARHNKGVTFTNLKLEVEGLYCIIPNENILKSLFALLWCVNIRSSFGFGFCILSRFRGGSVWVGSVGTVSSSTFWIIV